MRLAIYFVRDAYPWFFTFSQLFYYHFIFDSWRVAGVDNEGDQVRLLHGDERLRADIVFDGFFWFVLHAARVDEQRVARAQLDRLIDAIPRGSGYIGYQRDALPDEMIKER